MFFHMSVPTTQAHIHLVSSFWRWSFEASVVAQIVKNLPAMQETRVQFLGQEDSPRERNATHSIILAWRIPRAEEFGGPWGHKESDKTW